MARKIVFFTGKGGTGKSTTAAAFALARARGGQRVLLVELGDSSFYQGLTNQEIGFQPLELQTNLHVAKWDGYHCLQDYIRFLVKSDAVAKLVFENPFMRTLIDIGPSLSELAIIGKITSGIRHVGPKLDYDLIVVDSYATGHMMALVRAPIGILEVVKFGPMATHCRDMNAVMRDPTLTGYAIVTLPEDLPVTESLELRSQLYQELHVPVEFILNRMVQPPVKEDEIKSFLTTDPTPAIKTFSRYILDKMQMQTEQARRLESSLPLANVLSADSWQVIESLAKTFSSEAKWMSY